MKKEVKTSFIFHCLSISTGCCLFWCKGEIRMHHYIIKYRNERNERKAVSWFQIHLFNKSFLFLQERNYYLKKRAAMLSHWLMLDKLCVCTFTARRQCISSIVEFYYSATLSTRVITFSWFLSSSVSHNYHLHIIIRSDLKRIDDKVTEKAF